MNGNFNFFLIYFTCDMNKELRDKRLEKEQKHKNRAKNKICKQSQDVIEEEDWRALKKEKKEEVDYSWNDVSLDTGDFIMTKSEFEESDEEIEIPEEIEIIDNDVVEKMKQNICGLQKLVDALDTIGLPSEFKESDNFLIHQTGNSLIFYLNSKVSFQYEDLRMKPPAVLFSVRLLATDEDIKSCTNAIHFPISDNCYRQVLLYIYKKKVHFYHCGYEHYSIDYLLQSIFNINSILQIGRSHIRYTPNYSFVYIYFSCNDIEIQQTYIVPAVEKLKKIQGISTCMASLTFHL